jgi:hypothetical protein
VRRDEKELQDVGKDGEMYRLGLTCAKVRQKRPVRHHRRKGPAHVAGEAISGAEELRKKEGKDVSATCRWWHACVTSASIPKPEPEPEARP